MSEQHNEMPDGKALDSQQMVDTEDISIGNVFSTSKPKNAMSGTASGVGNICVGVLGGAAIAVAAPIKGNLDMPLCFWLYNLGHLFYYLRHR